MCSKEQLIEILEQYRQMPSETELFECKEAKSTYDLDNLGKYFSAISNEANIKGRPFGWIFFGISDKAPRNIVGTQWKKEPSSLNSLKHEIAVHTKGITFVEIYELNHHEGRVLMFQIPRAPLGIPTSWKGHYYGRNGESLCALSLEEFETIRHQINMSESTQKIKLEVHQKLGEIYPKILDAVHNAAYPYVIYFITILSKIDEIKNSGKEPDEIQLRQLIVDYFPEIFSDTLFLGIKDIQEFSNLLASSLFISEEVKKTLDDMKKEIMDLHYLIKKNIANELFQTYKKEQLLNLINGANLSVSSLNQDKDRLATRMKKELRDF